MRLTRATVARLGGTVLPLLLCPQQAFPVDFIGEARRAVVRGAQVADVADSLWQQVAGEVEPAWRQSKRVDTAKAPPPFVDEAFADEVLSLSLDVGARCAGVPLSSLQSKLPAAREAAILLYQTPAADGGRAAPAGAAVRRFPPAFATAIDDGVSIGNSSLFAFESYVRWRVLQDVLSEGRSGEERAALARCFRERLGLAMIDGPLKPALSSLQLTGEGTTVLSAREAMDGCAAILQAMRQKGVLSRIELPPLDSSTEEIGPMTWQYVLSGSVLVGSSQLAQDRTAQTGTGAGLYPGQLVSAPLAAWLRGRGAAASVDEYFLDNRVGRPDPRTFSDLRYYSDVLLEVEVK